MSRGIPQLGDDGLRGQRNIRSPQYRGYIWRNCDEDYGSMRRDGGPLHEHDREFAAPPSGAERKIAVSYADINISNPSGAAILLDRIALAAKNVCGPEPDIRDLTAHRLYDSCYKSAMNKSVASVASSTVQRIYAGLPQVVASK